jgi:SNF2 family DNA or RNA helicase
LEENNIKNVFCKGNCYQRDKAITEFNNDDKIKVIMLSSGSAASGTNLTKASKVILIDPIYGDYKYRKDQERQAVGRAHRTGQTKKIQVVRFIVKNTVEEEIHKMNLVEDAKHVDSKDADEVKETTIKAIS